MIAQIGATAIDFLEELSSVVRLLSETLCELKQRVKARRAPIELKELFYQTNRVGVGSIPMIVLLSFFVGLTMALLVGRELENFGMVSLVPSVVGIAFSREMGPLFTGIVLAARIGASFTAELGAMTAGGEVDAIEGMGIGALRYLVTSRLLAIFTMTPCLTVIAAASGIVGGALISGLLLQLGYSFFFDQVFIR